MADLNSLPPPPKNQTGMTLDQFQHLPPPPKGQTGLTLDQIKTPTKPVLGQGGAGELGSGFIGSLVKTGAGIESGLDQTVGRVANAVRGNGFTPTHTADAPNVTADKLINESGFSQAGNTIGTIAPYFMGGGEAQGAETLATKAPGFLAKAGGYLAKAAPTAARDFALGTAQTGSPIQGAETAATMGLTKGAGDAVAPFLSKLPTRIAQKALAGSTPETADHALKTTKIGPISQLLEHSKAATASGGKQIEAALSHPDNIGKTVDGKSVFQRVMEGNPDIPQSGLQHSGMSQQKLAQTTTKLVPNHADLVQKLFSGKGLSLPEANTLRQSLDSVVKAVYINGQKIDAPAVAASKQVGAEVASAIRESVKGQAKETAPMFEALQKEINLRNALGKAKSKLDKRAPVGLYDILSGVGGFAHSGPLGAIGTIAAEKAARSPGIQLGTAKIAQKIGPAISKTVAAGTKAAIPPLIQGQGRANQ